MNKSQAIVGQKVRSLVEFSGVPKGTTGTIVEDYGTGVMVEWDGIPHGIQPHGLRDGFDKRKELQFLEVVR